NPFLVWLGNLKLTPFDDTTARAVKDAASRIAKKAHDPGTAAWKPGLHQIEKWWGAPTLNALAALCDGIRRPNRERAPGVTDLLAVLPKRGYPPVTTSPPYPNRMSYIRELRPYMYWLGYLSDGRAAGELDWKAIGGTWGCATSMLNTWASNGHGHIPFPHFDH